MTRKNPAYHKTTKPPRQELTVWVWDKGSRSSGEVVARDK
jgi:hypothetical protein